MILFERYLLGRIFRLTGLLFLVLIFLTILYLTIAYTAIDYEIPPHLLFELVGVRFTRYIPRLLTISLFLGSLLCFLQLQSDRELLAMATSGFSFKRHVLLIAATASVLTGLIAATTFLLLPKIESHYNDLRAKARQLLSDPDLLKPGKFYSDRNFSIYFADREADGTMTNGVHVYLKQKTGYTVIVSDSAGWHWSGDNGWLAYHNGSAYNINDNLRGRTDFSHYNMPLQPELNTYDDYDTWKVSELLAAGGGAHYATLHKRVAPTVATFLLPLFALLLVIYSNRWRGRYVAISVSIIVFFVYYNFIDFAHTMIRKEILPAATGMLLPHLCLALLIWILWSAINYRQPG